MRRKPVHSGLLERHGRTSLSEMGAADAPVEAPGDPWAHRLFSFYVDQHLEHPAGTGLPGEEDDDEGRAAGQDEAGCWQHPCGSSVGGLVPHHVGGVPLSLCPALLT